VLVSGFGGPAGSERDALDRARRRMLAWHRQFSRFDPDSELSALNGDDREVVPVSAMMARFVAAARHAAEWTGGLVDATLVGELERAGYRRSFAQLGALPLAQALASAPARRPARPRPGARWRSLTVDRAAGIVSRPPGVGLFGDVLAGVLGGHASFAIDACGDLRFGGRAGVVREVRVASPFDDSIIHAFELTRGAAATSGIGRRAWLDDDARPAHHVLDPATGRPAYTGVVQVTALAATGVEAEIRAKAALLSGAAAATDWLMHGGVVVFDDGNAQMVPAAPALRGTHPTAAVAA
jgi:thiamine biosynthesis lipoprotein